MKVSRREFVKSTGLLCAGAAAQVPWNIQASTGQQCPLPRPDIAELALHREKKLGCSYADIRINKYRHESVFTREQQVLNVSRTHDFGFGIRVLYQGAWGFAASHIITPQSIRKVTEQAFDIARANARYQHKPIQLVSAEKVTAKWKSAFEKDPFDVPMEKKVEFLLKLNELAMQAKGASFVSSGLTFQNEDKFFASSEGS